MYLRSSAGRQSGQTLIEVLIVLVVGSIMLTGLSVMVISSLRNAEFAQNQIKATKYAQDAIDKIRAIRDWNQDGSVILVDKDQGQKTISFSGLWAENLSVNFPCGSDPGHYFTLTEGSDPSLVLQDVTCTNKDTDLNDKGLTRQIFITDTTAGNEYQVEKTITVKVSWMDAGGRHDSNLQTILTPLSQ